MNDKNEARELAQHLESLRVFESPLTVRAARTIRSQVAEIEGMRAQRIAYASEFPLDNEGMSDVGSIHRNIRSLKAEIERLNSIIESQWEDRQEPLKRGELYMRECQRFESEIERLKAELQRVYAVVKSHAEITFKAEDERDKLKAKTEKLIDLLTEVSRNYTRDDDLPDELLPRIDATLEENT